MLALGEMERLEDLFETLGVGYEERVLAVHRMRILRRFGLEAQALERHVPTLGDAEYGQRCAEALRSIHEQCRRGIRELEPLFKKRASGLVQLRRKPVAMAR